MVIQYIINLNFVCLDSSNFKKSNKFNEFVGLSKNVCKHKVFGLRVTNYSQFSLEKKK